VSRHSPRHETLLSGGSPLALPSLSAVAIFRRRRSLFAVVVVVTDDRRQSDRAFETALKKC